VAADLSVDVAIAGGGIAGLWLLAALRSAGFSAVLCERGALGGGQTLASQGIIHGGSKYALTGALSPAAKAIGAMPERWRQALRGSGNVDLRAARVLSEHQYLWSTEGLGSRLAGFFAGRLMRSRVQRQAPAQGPELFRNPRFRGVLYRLEEPVLELRSVVETLREQYLSALLALDLEPGGIDRIDANGVTIRARFADGDALSLVARTVVIAAGIGNEAFAQWLGIRAPATQRRPLGMIMARGPLPELYAHCLGPANLPRLTVTTHRDTEGRVVWYIGGAVAERGAALSAAVRIAATRQELRSVLPWLELAGVEWSTLRVDRAEPAVAGGGRPDSVAIEGSGPVKLVWPTKLALAPELASRVVAMLASDKVVPGYGEQPALAHLPRPPVASYPWDRELAWS
jgi:glycine/D-amino acid oxidase-like deaminating enzyme